MQKPDDTLTIVTAASSNHYRCLRNLLVSLDHHETAPVVVYDIGLSSSEADALRAEGRHVVRFPFERYPAFFGTRARSRAPCCWKPPLIRDAMDASGGAVLWMDAGNLVHERLHGVRRLLATTGFYSPASLGDIGQFTHPQVLALLDARPEILADRNRNGAIIGFGCNELGNELSRRWRDCALRQEIMWPADWTKNRWRSDQAILTILVAQARRRNGFALVDGRLGISTHNDRLSARSARHYMTRPPNKAVRDRLLRRDRRLEAMAQHLQRVSRHVTQAWRAVRRSWRRIKTVALRG